MADDTIHIPTGIGYLKVPCSHSGKYKFVRTCYTPEIPATILSPDAMGQELDCQGYQTHSDFRRGYATLDLTNCKSQMDPVHFELKLICGLLFMEYMIAPTEAEHVFPHLLDGTCSPEIPDHLPCSGLCPTAKDVNALTCNQLQALRHMCLGHINE